MKGVTNSVLYLLYIQENCVRAYRGGGVQANAYALRTGEGGVEIGNFLRTYFMDGPFAAVLLS